MLLIADLNPGCGSTADGGVISKKNTTRFGSTGHNLLEQDLESYRMQYVNKLQRTISGEV